MLIRIDHGGRVVTARANGYGTVVATLCSPPATYRTEILRLPIDAHLNIHRYITLLEQRR